MKQTLLSLPLLFGACALTHAEGGMGEPNTRLPVALIADGRTYDREVRFKDVDAGQVLFEGNWTVYFVVTEADMTWIRDLTAHHDSVSLEWNGFKVWSFHEQSRADGYFIDRDFNDEATARQLASEIKARQGLSGK